MPPHIVVDVSQAPQPGRIRITQPAFTIIPQPFYTSIFIWSGSNVFQEAENMLRCPDPKPALYNDVPDKPADVAVASCMNPALSSWTSPCPAASWDQKDFQGRRAFIRTVKDQCFPYDVQNMIIEGTGQEWILRDIDAGHCPNLSHPEKLVELVVELAEKSEAM